jgi:hypothetical protein
MGEYLNVGTDESVLSLFNGQAVIDACKTSEVFKTMADRREDTAD